MALCTASARSNLPDRIVIYGVEGVGKTHWAAGSVKPVFLLAEDGVRNLDVPKLMNASGTDISTFNEVMAALTDLTEEPHDFKTLVVDTVDWLEPLIRQHVVATHCQGDDEKYDAFGRGVGFSMNYWRQLLARFDSLRVRRGMEIILVAHAQLKAEESPTIGAEIKRYGLKLPGTANAQVYSLVREWPDSLLFATFEETAKKEGDKIKGNLTGRRVVKTVRGMMWAAKTRWALPPELPLSYEAYAKARGTLSRLPEFREAARARLGRLVSHPAYKDMDEAVTKAWDNETELGGVLQELNAVQEPESF